MGTKILSTSNQRTTANSTILSVVLDRTVGWACRVNGDPISGTMDFRVYHDNLARISKAFEPAFSEIVQRYRPSLIVYRVARSSTSEWRLARELANVVASVAESHGCASTLLDSVPASVSQDPAATPMRQRLLALVDDDGADKRRERDARSLLGETQSASRAA